LKRLKTLAWIPLPASKLESTVWRDNSTEDMSTLVDKDFEELFEATPGNVKATSHKDSPKKQANKTLIGLQRANNIVILLNSFKTSIPNLKAAIINFDETFLTVDRLKGLKSMAPTDDERKVKTTPCDH
jgi:hypothetical protein